MLLALLISKKTRSASQGLRVALWLVPLLQTCDGLETVVSDPDQLEHIAEMRWLPMASLTFVLQVTPDTIPRTVPYLKAEPERVERWRSRLGVDSFEIGIAWQGNLKLPNDDTRSIALREFAPLAELPGTHLIVLQKGFGATRELTFKDRLETMGDNFDSDAVFLDSAAVMMQLDLIVTSDTSIAHLRGASGRTVFVALRKIPDWCWFLGRDDTPWYPSMRLFRQTEAGDRHSVFDRMARAARERASHIKSRRETLSLPMYQTPR
jgi:hypothetical protein